MTRQFSFFFELLCQNLNEGNQLHQLSIVHQINNVVFLEIELKVKFTLMKGIKFCFECCWTEFPVNTFRFTLFTCQTNKSDNFCSRSALNSKRYTISSVLKESNIEAKYEHKSGCYKWLQRLLILAWHQLMLKDRWRLIYGRTIKG